MFTAGNAHKARLRGSCVDPHVLLHTNNKVKMMPISASDILRKNAPRETLGFAHANRYEKLRENSPAPSYRSRADSNVSQKRKVSESDLSEISNCEKVSRLDQDEVEELVLMDSKISKVSILCGKLYMVVQQQQLEVDDPLRSTLADIIEAIKITNEVQNELSGKFKTLRESQLAEQSQVRSYSEAAAMNPRPVVTVTDVSGRSGGHAGRKKLSGGLVAAVADPSGKFLGNQSKGKPLETEEQRKLAGLTKLFVMLRGQL